MDITIYGSGAIGGLIGGFMANAGEKVTFAVKNNNHVEAIRTNGLRIKGVKGDIVTYPEIHIAKDINRPLYGMVIIATKSQHTDEVLADILPKLADDAFVVSAQNGLNIDNIASQIGKERTIGCYVGISGDLLEPGIINYGRQGLLSVGELDGSTTVRLKEIQKLFSYTTQCDITDNIYGMLWSKEVFGLVHFLSALADVTLLQAMQYRENCPMFFAVMSEAYEVTKKLGIKLEKYGYFEPDILDLDITNEEDRKKIEAYLVSIGTSFENSGKPKSGVWRDLAVRKRKTEIDSLAGLIIKEGYKFGMEMKLTNKFVDMIHELEDGKRVMSTDNFDDLGKFAGIY